MFAIGTGGLVIETGAAALLGRPSAIGATKMINNALSIPVVQALAGSVKGGVK